MFGALFRGQVLKLLAHRFAFPDALFGRHGLHAFHALQVVLHVGGVGGQRVHAERGNDAGGNKRLQ
ncbi:hypothetical protein D3C83_225360 [compost metagenome]